MFDRIAKALADRIRAYARMREEWRAFSYEVWRSGLQGALAKGLPQEEIARYRAQVRRYAPSGSSPADERKAEMAPPIWYLMGDARSRVAERRHGEDNGAHGEVDRRRVMGVR